MGSQLQQLLRSFCFNTGWKYAVFWKLKHQAKMSLTWGGAFYDCNLESDKIYINTTAGIPNDGSYSYDPLGLAYQVYSLGEGIIGEVLVSGKHSWIYSDIHIGHSSTTSEYFGGWQNQFLTGIKTIAVVPVLPHGVVQLGSLHEMAEDLKLVDHIRNVFSELQVPVAGSMQRICLSDMDTRMADSAFFHVDEMNSWSQLFSSRAQSHNHSHMFPPSECLSNKTIKMKIHERIEYGVPGNKISVASSSKNTLTRQKQKEVITSLDVEDRGEMNNFRDLGERPEILNMTSIKNVRSEQSNLYKTAAPTDSSQIITTDLASELPDFPCFRDLGVFHVPEIPIVRLHQDFEKNLEPEIMSNCVEKQISPFNFCAGYELYEALGASFQKQNDFVWEAKKTCDIAEKTSSDMGNSSLLMDNSDMHLLDAVVAKISYNGDDKNSEGLCRETAKSLLTTEKISCMSVGTISSAGYSFDRDTSSSFNSVTFGVEFLKGFSSTSSSIESGNLEKPQEPVKISKKRARPGESCNPRPRDRQLIQERVKELRDLVPNGSKCSIDSLLERTVKHTLFLQSITKHAVKLHKCSALKLLDKETGMRRFSCHEQGSSWAVEVGSNSKICPIMVENINKNGQMLVEMLCEEWNQFLDVAETITSLGLTILKCVSEPHGDKTWMCFVVEGQNNRSIHRMDILWSLMQLLQPKTSEVINA